MAAKNTVFTRLLREQIKHGLLFKLLMYLLN